MKSIRQIREASGGKEAYQKFFNSILKKFGVDSPSELKGDRKKNSLMQLIKVGMEIMKKPNLLVKLRSFLAVRAKLKLTLILWVIRKMPNSQPPNTRSVSR